MSPISSQDLSQLSLHVLGHCPGAARRRKSCSKWKQLQVESVDIKRLPDGSSRGFAFVKFADKELQG